MVWISVGAWLSGLTWALRWAMPEGYYFDGKVHPWAPAWIPTVLGLIIFLFGLIPYDAATSYWSRKRSQSLRPSVVNSPTLAVRPPQPNEELQDRLL